MYFKMEGGNVDIVFRVVAAGREGRVTEKGVLKEWNRKTDKYILPLVKLAIKLMIYFIGGHSCLSENDAELIRGAVRKEPHDSQPTRLINQAVWRKPRKLISDCMKILPKEKESCRYMYWAYMIQYIFIYITIKHGKLWM